jgi:hypothetical protein
VSVVLLSAASGPLLARGDEGAAGPVAAPEPPEQVLARITGCLGRLRGEAATAGTELPRDCGSGLSGTAACTFPCGGECLLKGDFNGDGNDGDVLVASRRSLGKPGSLYVFSHLLAPNKPTGRRGQPPEGPVASLLPAAQFPLQADRLALLGPDRVRSYLEDITALDGIPNTALKLLADERLVGGLATWRKTPQGWQGEVSAVIAQGKDATSRYRLLPLIPLESASEAP